MGYETSGEHYKTKRDFFKRDCVEKKANTYTVIDHSLNGNDGYLLCESKEALTKSGEKLRFISHVRIRKEGSLFWFKITEDEYMPPVFTCPLRILNGANSDRGEAEKWREFNKKAIADRAKEKENIKNMVKGQAYYTHSGKEVIFESHETASKFLGVLSETGKLTYCGYHMIKWD